jgi:CheY-like chemotaxis protein
VLDVMMPGRDGLSVLRVLREKRVPTPVLLVTARGEVSERVEGLMLGADDYLSKPFAMNELVARVIALSRRAASHGMTMLRVEDLTMNVATREVTRPGRKSNCRCASLPCWNISCARRAGCCRGRSSSRNVWEWHFDTGRMSWKFTSRGSARKWTTDTR